MNASPGHLVHGLYEPLWRVYFHQQQYLRSQQQAAEAGSTKSQTESTTTRTHDLYSTLYKETKEIIRLR